MPRSILSMTKLVSSKIKGLKSRLEMKHILLILREDGCET